MTKLMNRVSLRKAMEQVGVVDKANSAPKAKAPKSPKAPKSAKTTAAPEATEVEAPKEKKARGRKGKTLGVPCYAAWTILFEAQGLAADGKENVLGLKKPMTDAEISVWMQKEYAEAGGCKEHDKAGMLRSLYNRGKINKQTAVPSRLVGEFVPGVGGVGLVEVVRARTTKQVAAS